MEANHKNYIKSLEMTVDNQACGILLYLSQIKGKYRFYVQHKEVNSVDVSAKMNLQRDNVFYMIYKENQFVSLALNVS